MLQKIFGELKVSQQYLGSSEPQKFDVLESAEYLTHQLDSYVFLMHLMGKSIDEMNSKYTSKCIIPLRNAEIDFFLACLKVDTSCLQTNPKVQSTGEAGQEALKVLLDRRDVAIKELESALNTSPSTPTPKTEEVPQNVFNFSKSFLQ